MEVSQPKSQSGLGPAATAALPVRPQSMDNRSMDTEIQRKRQLAEAEGFKFDKKACKLAELPKASPVDLSNPFQVSDSDPQQLARRLTSPVNPKCGECLHFISPQGRVTGGS